jgi:hypothetical protein
MTQDEIVEMVKKAGWSGLYSSWTNPTTLISFRVPLNMQQLEAFTKLVAAKEREACAKIVEDSPSYDWHKFACEAAAAIRARGQA